jgi:uncharacterized protein (DUF1778 family)
MKNQIDKARTQAMITVYVTHEEKQLIKDMASYFGRRNVSVFMRDLAMSKAKIYKRRAHNA